VSEDTVFLTAPRFLQLLKPRTKVVFRLDSPKRARVTFSSSVFQHRFTFDLPGISHQSSDNYFELYPSEPKTVALEFAQPQTLKKLQRAVTHHSLVDTY
jgi:beta-mannosidase